MRICGVFKLPFENIEEAPACSAGKLPATAACMGRRLRRPAGSGFGSGAQCAPRAKAPTERKSCSSGNLPARTACGTICRRQINTFPLRGRWPEGPDEVVPRLSLPALNDAPSYIPALRRIALPDDCSLRGPAAPLHRLRRSPSPASRGGLAAPANSVPFPVAHRCAPLPKHEPVIDFADGKYSPVLQIAICKTPTIVNSQLSILNSNGTGNPSPTGSDP